MVASVPLEYFSLSKSFDSPITSFPFVVGDEVNDKTLDRLEYYHGFQRGGAYDYLASSQNTLTCRQDVANLLSVKIHEAKVMLYLPKATVHAIHQKARNNALVPIEQRTRPEQDFPAPFHEYDIVFPQFGQPIYVRDPTTLQVVCHEAPYINLPRVQSTLHPCLWAAKTAVLAIMCHAVALPPDLVYPVFKLSDVYRCRIPLEFFYLGGRALGDFPSRHLPYSPRELGVPILATARKRGHDEVDSDDDVRTAVDTACDLPGIEAWCNSARNGSDSQSMGSYTIIGCDMESNFEDKESVRSVAAMDGGGDQWLQVLKRRSEHTDDKSVRKYYVGLVRTVQREHGRSVDKMRLPRVATRSQPARKIRRVR